MATHYTGIYRVSRRNGEAMTVEQVWREVKGNSGFAAGYDSFCRCVTPGDQQETLLALDPESRRIDGYCLADGGEDLMPVHQTSVPRPYSAIRAFNVGGQPHLLGYEPKSGTFDIYRIGENLSLTHIAEYARNYGHPTTGLTTIAPYSYRGEMLLLGYDMGNGLVSIYRFEVTAEAALTVNLLWSHQWSEGWTRFSLFQLGGENFFLKTNLQHKTVYIDHLCDDPTQGSHPVGRHLPLPIDLTATTLFALGGEHYIATYRGGDGSATLERLHDDCQGWSQAASFTAVTAGNRIVPLMKDNTRFLLIY